MFEKIAQNIVCHSLELKPGEKLNILIRGKSQEPLGREIEKVANELGITTRYAYDNVEDFETFTDEELEKHIQKELAIMKESDACSIVYDFIPIKLSEEARKKREHFFEIVHSGVRLKKRWNVTSLPVREVCKSEMDFQEMYDTYIQACSIDYDKMSKAMDNLVERLMCADKVRIVAEGTDISFSIKGLPPVKCIGKRNMPDGEVYTAPVKDSVNGVISYNFPSEWDGVVHNNIRFEFKDGKIVNESSDHTEELTKTLNTDEGARYIGEFSFGLNPYISRCFNNALYDEKISGTIHFTPGAAYERCDNGNKSSIHWDIVQSHTPEYGGGEIWLDDELIRKDGLFVVDYLKCLNPANLADEILNNEKHEESDLKTNDLEK